jgi:DNA-binding beta-propeller fold protein YncE
MNGFLTRARLSRRSGTFHSGTEGFMPVRTSLIVMAALALFAAGCGDGGGSKDNDAPSKPAAKAATPRVHQGPLLLRFRHAGTLPAPVQLPAVAPLASGDVLAMGGLDQADGSSSAIVRVSGHSAHQAGTLPSALHDAAAGSVGARTLFIGGGNAGTSSSAIDLVSPGGVASRIGSLPTGASDVSAATVGNAIYVVGGYDGAKPLDTIVRVTPSGHSTVVAHLPYAVRYASVAAVGGKVIVAGGTIGTSATDRITIFDPATRKVRSLGRLPRPTTHAGGAAAGGEMFVIGGRGGLTTTQRASVVAIDPATGHTHAAGHLPAALSDISATTTGGHIVALGGRTATGGTSDAIFTGVTYRRTTKVADAPAPRPAATAAAGTNIVKAGSIPPLLDPHNVYAAERPNALSPVARRARSYVYVPNSKSDTVDVINQATGRIVRHFAVGALPQHVVPSWDLRTLYVTNDEGNTLTPIDPRTGRPGKQLPVTDPYNLYFTADGKYAIVVEEAHKVLAFRDAHTMKLHHALAVPQCAGVDHMDFTADGRIALASCEFNGRMVVIDLVHERVRKTIDLSPMAMPQDVKLSPDGRVFYVADMVSNGVWLVDAHTMRKLRFMPTGSGAHGLYPSRDAKTLFVTNRGEGTISLIDFATRHVRAKWHLPGGGSPDMGGLSADGKALWLSGRYNNVVYKISTRTGHLLRKIPVGAGPHGLCVWPQPGRYSIGHTGILR